MIVAVSDDGKNFAVTDIGPATNYTVFRLEEVGEITPGNWKMVVTLSAENFKKNYEFELTATHDGRMSCRRMRARGWDENLPRSGSADLRF